MKKTTIAKGVVALSMVAVLAVPTVAYATPGMGRLGNKPPASQNATMQAIRDERLALLKQRIEMVLANRKLRFDNAYTRISARITKVSGIADEVEKAGGDVSGVRASLEKATGYLAQAKAAEEKTIAMFTAVPDAQNKKAAFMAAKAQGKIARLALNNARLEVRNAILNLRSIANGLKGAEQ